MIQKSLKKFLLPLLLFIIMGNQAKSTHLMGSDLFYRCIEPGLYEISLHVFRDCNGIRPNFSPITARDGVKTISLNSATTISVTDITGLTQCGIKSRCEGGSFPYGVEEYIYRTTLDLRAETSCDWTIGWSQAARNSNITTGSKDQNFYTEAKLNKCLASCNSSPIFSTPPVAIICHNQDVVFNNGALDTLDFGDSLSYELTNGLQSATASITYSGQFSPLRPLTFWGFPNQNLAPPAGFHLDPVTGDLRFRPITLNQVAVVVVKVKEWRKDVNGTWQQIGETRRDMQMIVVNCAALGGGSANTSPVLTSISPVRVCSGDSTCVQIVASDANTNDTVRLSWNGGLPGGSFNVINPGGKRDTAYICWRPKESDTSSVPYTFVVTAVDNACPIVGRTSQSYSFQVYLKPETRMEFSVDTCGLVQLKSIPKSSNYFNPEFSWMLRTETGDTVYQGKSVNPQAYAFIVPGTYYVYHRITIESGVCFQEFYDTFTMAPYPVVRTSIPNDTSVCQFSPITLTATGTGGLLPYSYVWSSSPSEITSIINPIIESDTIFVVTVYDKIGCFHRDTAIVTSVELPKAKIGANRRAHCYTDNLFSFYDSSTMEDHSFTRLWHLGESDTTSLANPGKSFLADGEYPIVMYVTSDFGCLDTAYDTIRVHPQSTPRFTINDSTQCLNGNQFELDASASSNPYNQIDQFYWNFGDATFDTAMVVQKSYSAINTKNVRLITETENGCKDTLIKTVEVYPQSSLQLEFSDTALCLNGNQISASAEGSTINYGYIQEYHWRWGDGTEDTGYFSPIKQYNTSDSFLVYLVGISNYGCRDSITGRIAIHPRATGQFSVDTSSLCLAQNQFNFNTNTLKLKHGSLISISWEFGDGQGDGGNSTSHQYNRADTFTVTLLTFSNFSCRDTFQRDITVYPQAELDFVSNADSQCSNINRFTLNASPSQIEWGSLDSFYWNFGNGQTDTGSYVDSLVYTGIGVYQVRLNTVSNFGCRDTLVKQRTVHPSPQARIIIQDDHQCFRDNLFSFTDNSSIGFTSLSRVWHFGDGDSSLQAFPTKSYSMADTFQVSLISISQFDCRDTATAPVWVHPQSIPQFSINDSIQCFRGHDYTFDASASSNPYEQITQYTWDFGDASANTGVSVTKQYSAYGTKMVRLVTLTESDCRDTLIKPIRINPQTQTRISFNDSQHCYKGNELIAHGNSSTLADGSIAAFEWTWGDGTQDTGRFAPTKTFATHDTFWVNLRTITDKSCRDSVFQRVVIHPQTVPAFTMDTAALCLKDNLFSFDASGSSIPYGAIASYTWNYGNGNTGSGINSQHTYANFDTFDVSVYTRSAMGCVDTFTQSLLVWPQSNLSIQSNADTQCLNINSYHFSSALSQIPWGSIDSFYWNIPTGGFFSGATVNGFSFPDSGTYTVTLFSVSDFGCKDTLQQDMLVYPRAVPKIEANFPDLCLRGNEFIYRANNSTVPTGTLDSFYWSLGDGGSYSGLQTAAHHYNSHDTFEVRLISVSNGICYDTTFAQSVVHPHPGSVLNANYLDHCLSQNAFDFNASSSLIHSGFIKEYHWNYGDGTLDTGIVISGKTYNNHGEYDLLLTSVSHLGCADTFLQKIVIHPQGVPVINVLDSFVCMRGNFFDMDGLNSSIPYGSINQYEWFFNDGSYFNTATVSLKNFSNYDTFGVKLRTVSDQGCLDSATRNFVVYPHPEARFVVNDSIQCFDSRQSFNFNASSSTVPSPWSGIKSYNWYSNDGVMHSGMTWNNKTYLNRGLYAVKLVVVSNDGCSDSITHQVHFYPPMSPRFNTPDTAQCYNEHEFVFNAMSSTIPLGTITDYQWKFTDFTSSNGSISPPKRFAHYDTFGVWLITTSNEDCQDSIYKEVIVFESPVINFEVDEVCLKQGSEFRNLTQTNRDSVVRWLWNFGDGNTSDTSNPIHYYQRAEKFNVKLTGTTSNGCSADTLIDSAAWVKPLPQSDFNFTMVDYDFEQVTFGFVDLSIQAIEWTWLMGDGSGSQEQNPIYTYADTGHFRVSLDVLNDLGCRDTMVKEVWALPEYEIYVPNSFTPNGDLLNETFAPKGTIYYKDYSMTIMNRWGEIMYQTNNMKEGWDGTNQGEACPMDSYGVYISVTDMKGVRHNRRGVLHLVR